MPLRLTHWLLPLLATIASACGAMYLEPDGSAGGGPIVDIQPPDELTFGPVSPVGAPARREAWVSADGGGRVALEEVVISPDGDGAFTLADDPTPCIVEAGDPVLVEVHFRPTTAGQFSGRMTFIASVDGNEVELSRRLAGSGCSDPDRDGACASSLPSWDPVWPELDTGEF